MPMVHPVTGETILSYKKLMKVPVMAEMWQTAFGKDFGGRCQGDDKTGAVGTDAIFVIASISFVVPIFHRTSLRMRHSKAPMIGTITH